MEVRKTKCSLCKTDFSLNVVLQDQDTNMLLLMHAYSVFNEENPTDGQLTSLCGETKERELIQIVCLRPQRMLCQPWRAA